ncbi:MAG: YceI family protein [Planctomycetota bacterium]|jgi:polyisoprenoid-binding protein YceI
MKSRTTIITAGVTLATGLLVGATLQPGSTAQGQSAGVARSLATAAPAVLENATTYTVDNVHSSTVFRISHMGVANFWGRFNRISGTYSFHPNHLDKSSFAIDIDTESIDTNSERRDGHLKSPDFFNAKEFPTIEFRSTKVERDGDSDDPNDYTLTGELKMHNVVKRIRAKLKWIDAKETRQGFKSGFEAVFSIKRTDFGMDMYVEEGGLGDRVRVIVAIEGVRQD